MADNITLNSGSGGATLAADDIASVWHQRVKIQYGTDGAATDVSDSNPLPIDDAGGSLTVDGTVTADAGTGPWPVTDNGGSLTVDNAALSVTGAGTESGALRVTIANDSTGLVSVDDGGGALTVDGTVTADAGTGPWPVTDNGGSITVDLPATTSGGLSMSKTISAASTNATSVKGSAGQVYGIYCTNVNASVRYLKLYNKASAPTVGTDTPVLTLAIPGNTAGAGFSLQQPMGIAFGTGIAFALTTGVADADTGAVAANEQVVNLLYK